MNRNQQTQSTTSQSARFNTLSLLQHVLSGPMFTNHGNGRTDQPHQDEPREGPPQDASFSTDGGTVQLSSVAMMKLSKAMTQDSQLQHHHHQQQLQQQQNIGSMLSEATRDQLVSLALSGDLGKAIQLASIALQQGNNHAGGNSCSTVTSTSRGPSSGGQNIHLLPMLESLSQQKNAARLNMLSMAARDESPGNETRLEAVDEEDKKGQQSIAVPCRARGIPMDHDFKVGIS